MFFYKVFFSQARLDALLALRFKVNEIVKSNRRIGEAVGFPASHFPLEVQQKTSLMNAGILLKRGNDITLARLSSNLQLKALLRYIAKKYNTNFNKIK